MMNKKMSIELASTVKVELLKEWVDKAIKIIGHPGALVTDWSSMRDFSPHDVDGKEMQKWIDQLSKKFGFKVYRNTPIVDIAFEMSRNEAPVKVKPPTKKSPTKKKYYKFKHVEDWASYWTLDEKKVEHGQKIALVLDKKVYTTKLIVEKGSYQGHGGMDESYSWENISCKITGGIEIKIKKGMRARFL